MNARLLKAATGTRVRGHRGWQLAEHHQLICVYIVDDAIWLLTNSGLYGRDKTSMDEIDRDLAHIIVKGFLNG